MKVHKISTQIPTKGPPCWLSLRLPGALLERLEAESKKTGQTKSFIVRFALERCLGGEE